MNGQRPRGGGQRAGGGGGRNDRKPAASAIPLPSDTAGALGLVEHGGQRKKLDWVQGWLGNPIPCDNPGLIFNRYLPNLQRVENRDDGGAEGEGGSGKGAVLQGLADRANRGGASAYLQGLIERNDRLAANCRLRGGNALRLNATLAYRLTAHLGLQHPTENGFCFHPLYGVPHIPGSGVKGAVRAALLRQIAESPGDAITSLAEFDDRGNIVEGGVAAAFRENPDRFAAFGALFGSVLKDRKHAERHRELLDVDGNPLDRMTRGRLVFLDAFPETCNIVCDVLTPHHKEYYGSQGGHPPHDAEDPSPTFFLAVEAGTPWTFHVLLEPCRPGDSFGGGALDELKVAFEAALGTWALGAKKAAGYGWFDRISVKEVDVRDGEEPLPSDKTGAGLPGGSLALVAPPPSTEHHLVAEARSRASAYKGNLGMAKAAVSKAIVEAGREVAERVANVWCEHLPDRKHQRTLRGLLDTKATGGGETAKSSSP